MLKTVCKVPITVGFFNVMGKGEGEGGLNAGNDLESFEMYRTLVDLSPHPVLIHFQERVVFVNPAFYKLLKMNDASQVLGQTTLGLAHLDSRVRVGKSLQIVLQNGETTPPTREKWTDGNGTILTLETIAAPVQWRGERAVQVVLRDVTELLQAEHQLNQVQRQVHALTDQLENFSMFSLDAQGRIDVWSTSAERAFGFSAPEIIRQPFDLIFTAEDRAQGVPAWEMKRAEQTGMAQGERWHLRKGRGRFFVKSLLISVRNERGDLLGFTKIALDQTKRKNAEIRLTESEARFRQLSNNLETQVAERTRNLEQSVQAWESFCYSIAHDLRAPLRTVSGFAQALLEDCANSLDLRSRDYTERMAAAAHRMDEFIQDLLDFGRLAHVALPRQPLDLKAALDSARLELEEEVVSTKARIQILGPFPMVLANPAAMKQILINLLTNAMKFVHQGVEPRVEVFVEDNGPSVRIWFQDHGIGIHPDHHERVFGLFERLHTQAEYPGTGAGLAIVRRAIERMGGSVGLQSTLGQGSSFWIELSKAV